MYWSERRKVGEIPESRMSDAAFVTGRLHIKEKPYTIMIDEYIEAMSEYMSEEHPVSYTHLTLPTTPYV